MKVALDECLPHRLRDHPPGHEVWTVRYAGFAGLKNGQLLDALEQAGFHALITADQGIWFQQKLDGRSIAVLIIRCSSNRFEALLPFLPMCLTELEGIKPGELVHVTRPA